ncbi:nose resistant to fluoxetine protein 6-like [Argiope bruennichi]|uniref:nose resistant to fluoxetine protein 6-like n=1 Tax=Argiope bruennichi TaxID=94029 RepID=UPI002494EE0F|nr:nose resistant to fluoxetine protein 6-like [Argiope bruennichi]XP_055932261.1 nose resistant to fluoxetine protein 6-like [Argiope bruennichi]
MKFIYNIVAIILLCVALEGKCQGSLIGDMVQNTENMTVLEKWQNMEKNLKKATSEVIKMALPHIMKASENLNISSQCLLETMKLVMGLKNLKPWAFKFIDSSAKMVDGLLVGSVSSLGVYDECLNTEVKSEKGKNKEDVIFRGKYCTIDIKPPLPPKAKFYWMHETIPELRNLTLSGTVMGEMAKYAAFFYFISLKMSICVPSGCMVEDIDQVAQMLGNYLMLEVKTSRCEVKEDLHFTKTNICVMFVYCFFGFLVLIGSLIDMYSYYTGIVFKRTSVKFFLSFSFISNFKKFVNTETTSNNNLNCLHGIRFLSMSWIILGHTYFLLNIQATQNLESGRHYGGMLAFQAILNGTVGVDTFFCIGGMLLCYFTIKIVKIEGKPFNIVMYIVHRLWRIYPVYILVILFSCFDYIMSSGPLMHHFTHPYVDNCYKNWWANLLFINNFYAVDKPCLGHSWYIASDLQLYIAALLILLPLLRWPKVGILLSVLAIIASVIFTGVQTYVKDLAPTMLFVQPDPAERTEFWKDLYFTPFTHIGPYCIGILAGYLLVTRPNFKMSATVQIIGWIAAFICCFSTVYGPVNWNGGKEINFFAGLMYASFHRIAWALGVAWLIVCCATGRGGVINYILSWKIFIPLGRLTFIAYLIHPLVQVAFMGNLRHIFVPSHLFIVWIFIADLWVSYAIAFAACMLVEAPMMSLEKIILRKGDKKTEDPSLARSNSILKGTLKPEKNGDIAFIVVSDSDKSLGKDNETFSKL